MAEYRLLSWWDACHNKSKVCARGEVEGGFFNRPMRVNKGRRGKAKDLVKKRNVARWWICRGGAPSGGDAVGSGRPEAVEGRKGTRPSRKRILGEPRQGKKVVGLQGSATEDLRRGRLEVTRGWPSKSSRGGHSSPSCCRPSWGPRTPRRAAPHERERKGGPSTEGLTGHAEKGRQGVAVGGKERHLIHGKERRRAEEGLKASRGMGGVEWMVRVKRAESSARGGVAGHKKGAINRRPKAERRATEVLNWKAKVLQSCQGSQGGLAIKLKGCITNEEEGSDNL
ncbi:hypothetical protein GOP47_0029017 [Adiantum capillus-veneris]|nr:hypothetical protein GOP47_0029017 [Adiantum capillus-veneris]